MKTRILAAASDLSPAIEALRSGEVVALPTETVYGLAADSLNATAVAKIFEAKDRPRFDPLIVHVPEIDCLERIAAIVTSERQLTDALINTFWPGPLTLVLPRTSEIPDIVTAGLDTVAVRMSAHLVFQRVIREFGRPLAAPSANRFGRISPTCARDVLAELDGRIALIVDGGTTEHGIESTIVAVRGGAIEVLRQGPITEEMLREFAEVRSAVERDNPEAPGQLRSHYAPRTPLTFVEDLTAFVSPTGARVGALTLQPCEVASFAETRVLSERGDLREAAANLFRCLRELDEAGLELIVAEKIPETGLGRAIMDRLRRATTR